MKDQLNRHAELSFDLLEAKGVPPLGELARMPSGRTTGQGEVVYALDQEQRRHLLVPTERLDAGLTDKSSNGIHLISTRFRGPTGEAPYIDLICVDRRFAKTFSRFADSLVANLSESDDAARTCVQSLATWRDMFRKVPDSVLPASQTCALLGELLFLERLAETRVGRALATWTGWKRDRFDFRGPLVALEIKTTLAKEGWTIRVHGLDQLDGLPDEELHLLIYRFEQVQAGGDSLPDAIQRLLDLGVDSAGLHAALLAVGYSPDETAYAAMRFLERGRRLYRVDDTFPRLVRQMIAGGDLPAGVTGVQYSVSLDAETPEPLDLADMEVVERRLLNL